MAKNPLSPEQIQSLQKMKASFPEQEAELARQERAGINVTVARDMLNQQKKLVEGLLREYSTLPQS